MSSISPADPTLLSDGDVIDVATEKITHIRDPEKPPTEDLSTVEKGPEVDIAESGDPYLVSNIRLLGMAQTTLPTR